MPIKKPYSANAFKNKITGNIDEVQDTAFITVGEKVHALMGTDTKKSNRALTAASKLIGAYIEYRLSNDPSLPPNHQSPKKEDVESRVASLRKVAGNHTGILLANDVFDAVDNELRTYMKLGKIGK